MGLTVGIIIALLSCFSWSIVDLACKIIIGKIGRFRLVFFINFFSSLPLIIYAFMFLPIPSLSFKMILLSVIIGLLLTVIGSLIYYRGLEKGDLSILSPVSSSWGIITVLLAIIFLNEVLSFYQSVSIILLFLGIVITSLSWSYLKTSEKYKLVLGSKEALMAMVFWGIGFFLLKYLIDEIGPIWSLVFIRYFATLLLILYGKAKHEQFRFSKKTMGLLIFIISLFDLAGFIGFNFGVSTEFVAIVTPIVSSYPAITVILAYLFLKERLERNQYFGIGFIIIGLISISLTS